MVSVTVTVWVIVVLPSLCSSRFRANSTTKICLHFSPRVSWSGQVQCGASGSGLTVYRPCPDCEGTSQMPPFLVNLQVAAMRSPRCSRSNSSCWTSVRNGVAKVTSLTEAPKRGILLTGPHGLNRGDSSRGSGVGPSRCYEHRLGHYRPAHFTSLQFYSLHLLLIPFQAKIRQ